MGTGLQRLKEKHANKKANVVQFNDEPPVPAKSKGNGIVDVSFPKQLDDKERAYFLAIMAALGECYDDTSRGALTAINLAKLYALDERLEAELNKNGLFIQDEDGNIKPHPGIRFLQQNRSLITSCINALGLKINPPREFKKEKEPETVSAFAQFQ